MARAVSSRRDETTPVARPTQLSPPNQRQCSILMQRSCTNAIPAARARSAAASSRRPSCSQIAFAPSAIASSTTAGIASWRRKTSTISSGPASASVGTAATPSTSSTVGLTGITS